MNTTDLDTKFQEAFEIATTIPQASLPQDVQLRLYAYYKQATFGTIDPNQVSNFDLRNAFKTNAWLQISHISTTEAKELYIETVNTILKK
jgi:acyl-CoA-binding protein